MHSWFLYSRLDAIGIGVSSGGQCDLTNSNSSFGIKGLVADGFGDIEFTGITTMVTDAQSDTIITATLKMLIRLEYHLMAWCIF